jgi:hypothetical protein
MQVKSQDNAQTNHEQQTSGWMQVKVNHVMYPSSIICNVQFIEM